MPPLVLSHLAAPAIPRRQLLALAMLALALATVGALRLADLREQAAALRADMARVAARHVQRTAGRAGTAHEQAVPGVRWGRVFAAMEAAASPDVSLLAFDPSPQQRRLRLDGEARDLAALLEYLRRLGTTGVFVQVRLQNHQAVRDDPQHPVRFSVVADWGEGT
jgi:Tfp pilus assembly protein PilN